MVLNYLKYSKYCLIIILCCYFRANISLAESIDIGVNRPGIAWLSTAEARHVSIDNMKNKKIKYLRIMLVTPVEQTLDVIAYCNKNNIKVLLMVPLTLDVYHPSNVVRREGDKSIYTTHKMSTIDVVKFRDFWFSFLDKMVAHGLYVSAIQIDNEFNSAVFNGDLPIVKGGEIVNNQNVSNIYYWNNYVTGMRKIIDVAKIINASKQKAVFLNNTPVVLGGLARPSTTWIQNVNASLVEPDLALSKLVELGIDKYVDAYAVHIYPQVPKVEWTTPKQAIRNYFEARMQQVSSVAGKNKPWWITEWGFRELDKDNRLCERGVDARFALFSAFIDVLSQYKDIYSLGPSFIYDWDESRDFKIYKNGSVLCNDNVNILINNSFE